MSLREDIFDGLEHSSHKHACPQGTMTQETLASIHTMHFGSLLPKKPGVDIASFPRLSFLLENSADGCKYSVTICGRFHRSGGAERMLSILESPGALSFASSIAHFPVAFFIEAEHGKASKSATIAPVCG